MKANHQIHKKTTGRQMLLTNNFLPPFYSGRGRLKALKKKKKKRIPKSICIIWKYLCALKNVGLNLKSTI